MLMQKRPSCSCTLNEAILLDAPPHSTSAVPIFVVSGLHSLAVLNSSYLAYMMMLVSSAACLWHQDGKLVSLHLAIIMVPQVSMCSADHGP